MNVEQLAQNSFAVIVALKVFPTPTSSWWCILCFSHLPHVLCALCVSFLDAHSVFPSDFNLPDRVNSVMCFFLLFCRNLPSIVVNKYLLDSINTLGVSYQGNSGESKLIHLTLIAIFINLVKHKCWCLLMQERLPWGEEFWRYVNPEDSLLLYL